MRHTTTNLCTELQKENDACIKYEDKHKCAANQLALFLLHIANILY